MIEVFRTNVQEPQHAERLLDSIHENFADYRANFDLQDCDRILRVICAVDHIEVGSLIDLLKDFGFSAEVLPD